MDPNASEERTTLALGPIHPTLEVVDFILLLHHGSHRNAIAAGGTQGVKTAAQV